MLLFTGLLKGGDFRLLYYGSSCGTNNTENEREGRTALPLRGPSAPDGVCRAPTPVSLLLELTFLLDPNLHFLLTKTPASTETPGNRRRPESRPRPWGGNPRRPPRPCDRTSWTRAGWGQDEVCARAPSPGLPVAPGTAEKRRGRPQSRTTFTAHDVPTRRQGTQVPGSPAWAGEPQPQAGPGPHSRQPSQSKTTG